MAIPSGYQLGANGYYYLTDGSGPFSVDATGKAFLSGSLGHVSAGALQTHAAAGAGTTQSADQANNSSRGLHLVIDITAISGTSPTLTVTVEGKDPVSGKYYTALASAALSAVATTVLKVYPGLTAAANSAANDVMPLSWRVKSVIGGTTPSVTATIGAVLLG